MGWVLLALLAAVTLAGLWLSTRRRRLIELFGAALLLGVVGYAWQGSPRVPGRPTPPRANQVPAPRGFALERRAWLPQVGGDAQVVDAADGLIARGDAAYAAGFLHAALMRDPKNVLLWTAFGNALAAYGDGMVTAPARYAYSQAAALAPGNPAPPYFLGLALAESGQFEEAARVWMALLRASPRDAPWRLPVAEKLVLLARLQRAS